MTPILAIAAMSACATETNTEEATASAQDLLDDCPVVEDSSGPGSLTVAVSNASLIESDPLVIAVTLAGTVASCDLVPQDESDQYTYFNLETQREHQEVTVLIWADGDPGPEVIIRSSSTTLEVDPVRTPVLVVDRRHVPPDAASISVEAREQLPSG